MPLPNLVELKRYPSFSLKNTMTRVMPPKDVNSFNI